MPAPTNFDGATSLETARLRLRHWRDEDLDGFAAITAQPEVMRYIHDGRTLDRCATAERLAVYQRHWDEHGFGLLAVDWKDTGELIGRVGPQYHRMWADDPEVGWAIDPAWWRRGIATEAGAAAVEWAFGALDYPRVVSITTDANVASQNVMAKLGFALHARVPSEWGVLRVHVLDR